MAFESSLLGVVGINATSYSASESLERRKIDFFFGEIKARGQGGMRTREGGALADRRPERWGFFYGADKTPPCWSRPSVSPEIVPSSKGPRAVLRARARAVLSLTHVMRERASDIFRITRVACWRRKSAPRSSAENRQSQLPAAEFVLELQKRVPDAVWKHSTRIIRRDRSRNGSMRDAERAALATDKSGQVSRVIYREKRDGLSRRPRFTSPYSALLSRRGLT